MAVYVDPLFDTEGWSKHWPYPQACHLMADTEEELHAFALSGLGMRRVWFQEGPPVHSVAHYDLTAPRRKTAVRLGAVEVDRGFFPVGQGWKARRAAAAAAPMCLHPRHWTAPCAPRADGCEHDHYCDDCGAHVGNESWNFVVATTARAAHDRRYNTVDKSATLCETQPMPRKKRGLPAPITTAASVLDELTSAAETIREADGAGADYATVVERLQGVAQIVKAAEAQGLPVPDEVRQSVPTLAEVVAEYKLRHERNADDEKALKVLRAAVLETLDDPAWNVTGTDDAPGDGFVLRRKAMPGREKLDTILLVEKGVDPAWITECTVPGDPYFELRVVMDKAAAE